MAYRYDITCEVVTIRKTQTTRKNSCDSAGFTTSLKIYEYANIALIRGNVAGKLVAAECIMHKGLPKRDTWDRTGAIRKARHGPENYECSVCKVHTSQVHALQV